MEPQTSGIIKGQTANSRNLAQFGVANQFPPVVLFIRSASSLLFLRTAIHINNNGLVQTHTVAKLKAVERLLNRCQESLLSFAQHYVTCSREPLAAAGCRGVRP